VTAIGLAGNNNKYSVPLFESYFSFTKKMAIDEFF